MSEDKTPQEEQNLGTPAGDAEKVDRRDAHTPTSYTPAPKEATEEAETPQDEEKEDDVTNEPPVDPATLVGADAAPNTVDEELANMVEYTIQEGDIEKMPEDVRAKFLASGGKVGDTIKVAKDHPFVAVPEDKA
jgi:hypothetical protein